MTVRLSSPRQSPSMPVAIDRRAVPRTTGAANRKGASSSVQEIQIADVMFT